MCGNIDLSDLEVNSTHLAATLLPGPMMLKHSTDMYSSVDDFRRTEIDIFNLQEFW